MGWTVPLHLMTSPCLAVATAVLASLALAGCSSSDSSTPSAGPASATPSTSSPAAPSSGSSPAGDSAYPVYVALGDSYTAAPLVPTTDTGNGCLRSDHNYPSLVAAAMPGTALTDVSCSGADSTSMIGVQETGNQTQSPQFDALSDATDLVTVSVGGNDFNLFGTIVGTCTSLRDSDPTGSPCRDRLTGGGKNKLAADLRQIRGHVTAIATGIADRAPNARVIVVGYPAILPRTGGCPDRLPLATGDVDFVRSITQGLVRAVKQGARAAHTQYADVYAATLGHDLCSDDPWINGKDTDVGQALAFHPFAAEQQAVADLLLGMLAQD